jgi:carboxyl-terminal processing protease
MRGERVKRTLEVTLRALVIGCTLVIVASGAYTIGFAAEWLGYQSSGLSGVPRNVLYPTAEEPPGFQVFWEAWEHVESEFYGDLPGERELTYGAIRGMLEALGDPYSYFIEPSDHQIEEAHLEGRHGGIGAEYVMADGYLKVVAVLEGSPAEGADLRTGDVISEVDGTEVLGLSQSEAILLIRGREVGSEAVLTVWREGEAEPLVIRAMREEVEVPTVAWELREAGVGYIRLSFFGARTSSELSRALQELKAAGATRLVLDLRDNPGGIVTTAVQVASEFIDTGVVFYERDKDGNDKVFNAQRGGAALGMPLAVLINGGTASAAEILCGAIQDHERGPLIGEATFGKGSLQSIHELSDNSSVHVTIAHWLTPDRHEIEGAGVAPDLEITPSEEALAQGQDPQLEAALHYLEDTAIAGLDEDLCQGVPLEGITCDAPW